MLNRAKLISFKIYAPQAKKVNLAGSFNKWNLKKISAKKDKKGNWSARVSLKPGRYEYKFLLDGVWVNDPHCPSSVTNAFGTQNSVIEVK